MNIDIDSCASENEKLDILTILFPYLNEPLMLPSIGIRESESSYVNDFNNLNEKLPDISLEVNK